MCLWRLSWHLVLVYGEHEYKLSLTPVCLPGIVFQSLVRSSFFAVFRQTGTRTGSHYTQKIANQNQTAGSQF
jgi:hypothetical protein